MTRDAIPLLVAVVASVSIHLAVVPLFTKQYFAPPFAPPPDASHLETPRIEQPEIELGIKSSEASTLTWIGYDHYREHVARLADVEQAAMQLERPYQEMEKSVLGELTTIIRPVRDIAKQLLEALGDLTFSTASPTPPPLVKPDSTPRRVVEDGISLDAEFSDHEADATSILEVPKEYWKTGRPLAAQGIILRPRRPSFTALQTVTQTSGGLTALLVIDHRGRPIEVEVIRSTGTASIDRSLVASLYRWRASGEKVDALGEGDTLNITIHISFAR